MNKKAYLKLTIACITWLAAGYAFEVIEGRRVISDLIYLTQEPALLTTDYMSNVSIGAAIINSALCGMLCIILMYILKTEIRSIHIAAIMIVMGHALFGKNLLNMDSILIGTFLAAKVLRLRFRDYLHTAFFCTGIAPVASFFAFELIHVQASFLVGQLLGVACGFITMYISLHIPALHNGYTLLNGGLACGIVATVLYSIMRIFGAANVVNAESPLSGDNVYFAPVMLAIFAALFFYGMYKNHGMHGFLHMQLRHGKGAHFFDEFGHGLTFMNMGLVGILCTLYVVAIGAELNGLTIGAIMTSVGFACYGQTVLADFPIMLGVLAGSLFFGKIFDFYTVEYNSTALASAAIFSTGLAPLSQTHHYYVGFFAGILHSLLVTQTAALQGYMSLYNNGFSIGIIAVIFNFLEQHISKHHSHRIVQK